MEERASVEEKASAEERASLEEKASAEERVFVEEKASEEEWASFCIDVTYLRLAWKPRTGMEKCTKLPWLLPKLHMTKSRTSSFYADMTEDNWNEDMK